MKGKTNLSSPTSRVSGLIGNCMNPILNCDLAPDGKRFAIIPELNAP
jgi:hypothetical protein